jgi:hypothetical protein
MGQWADRFHAYTASRDTVDTVDTVETAAGSQPPPDRGSVKSVNCVTPVEGFGSPDARSQTRSCVNTVNCVDGRGNDPGQPVHCFRCARQLLARGAQASG